MDEIARGGALSCGGLYEELIEMRTLMRADRALRDQVDEAFKRVTFKKDFWQR